jgi:hypothetical protein
MNVDHLTRFPWAKADLEPSGINHYAQYEILPHESEQDKLQNCHG